jgi:hypothetical protein
MSEPALTRAQFDRYCAFVLAERNVLSPGAVGRVWPTHCGYIVGQTDGHGAIVDLFWQPAVLGQPAGPVCTWSNHFGAVRGFQAILRFEELLGHSFISDLDLDFLLP